VRLVVAVGLLTGLVGIFCSVGADSRWLAALGHVIASTGSIPAGVPFAAAPTRHWPNVLVLAELIFNLLEREMGDRGLVLAQLVAVAAALGILARDAQAGGARSFGTASALALAVVGAFASLAIARVQMFSLVMFPLLVALVRAEARCPSPRIWLALPLLAAWSNLHGAVLSGLAVLYAYLALSRFRRDRLTAIAVGVGALVALCLTPAGIRTVAYYHGLVTNLAAERHVGLWAPLGHSPLDWLLVATTASLAIRLRRHRPPAWELAVIAGLAVLTVDAARSGVWLLFFLVAPAARLTHVKQSWNGLLPVGAAAAIALLVAGVAHVPRAAHSESIVRRAIAAARGTAVLADAELAERVALGGGRIWAGNPLDAFSRRDQGVYLDWIAGAARGRAALTPEIGVVLVPVGSAAQRLMRAQGDFSELTADRRIALYARIPRASAKR
jgi:hypothetical protein